MPKFNHKKKQNSRWPLAVGLLFFLAFAFLVFIIFKVATVDKFIYVNKTEAGDAEIIIVDSKQSRIIKYLIPFETELDSARGYGKYKISSLWTLSEKNNNGKLISETIAKNLFLPVYLWKNEVKSNLNIYQKIRVFFNKSNKNIDLEINSTKLPNSDLIQFVNPEFIEIIPKIEVEDLTNSLNTLDKVSNIIEVAGGKITSNSRGYDADLDCEIYGKKLEVVNIFSNIFSCNSSVDETLSTDLKIRLGAKFSERF